MNFRGAGTAPIGYAWYKEGHCFKLRLDNMEPVDPMSRGYVGSCMDAPFKMDGYKKIPCQGGWDLYVRPDDADIVGNGRVPSFAAVQTLANELYEGKEYCVSMTGQDRELYRGLVSGLSGQAPANTGIIQVIKDLVYWNATGSDCWYTDGRTWIQRSKPFPMPKDGDGVPWVATPQFTIALKGDANVQVNELRTLGQWTGYSLYKLLNHIETAAPATSAPHVAPAATSTPTAPRVPNVPIEQFFEVYAKAQEPTWGDISGITELYFEWLNCGRFEYDFVTRRWEDYDLIPKSNLERVCKDQMVLMYRKKEEDAIKANMVELAARLRKVVEPKLKARMQLRIEASSLDIDDTAHIRQATIFAKSIINFCKHPQGKPPVWLKKKDGTVIVWRNGKEHVESSIPEGPYLTLTKEGYTVGILGVPNMDVVDPYLH